MSTFPTGPRVWPMRLGVEWVAAHVFGLKTPLVSSGSGSGDKTFDWVLLFCLLVLSVAATTAWSVLDRRRPSYTALDGWFRVFIRFCLAGQMLTYGMVKAVPLQMPFPFLFTQVEPFGNLSPMGILWASVGASPVYEMFAGCAELTAGFLLIFPRTATLGALVCLADLVEIFVLNMTYDVPVKLFSFHLILLCLFLLAPEFRRLANFFFLNRTAEPSRTAPLFKTGRSNRIAFAAGTLLWAWMIFCNVYGAWDAFHKYGPGRPKPDLYGIWDVEQVTMDGQSHPPLLTDNVRWRRMIVDFPEFIQVQRMDDTRSGYTASVDPKAPPLGADGRQEQELESAVCVSTSVACAADAGWLHRWSPGANGVAPSRRNKIPVRKPRLPLDSGVSVQQITGARVAMRVQILSKSGNDTKTKKSLQSFDV